MEMFNQCIESLRTARTDTEKFAALLLVTKVFKSDTLPPTVKHDLYHAIGENFLKRLLHTDSVPAGCPPYIFKSIALAVLAALCSGTEKDTIDLIVENISVIEEVLAVQPQTPEERIMVEDALLCLNFAISDESQHKAILNSSIVNSLVKVYLQERWCSEKALQVFLSLLVHSPKESWETSSDAIHRLLAKLAVTFHSEQTKTKFEVAGLLTSIIATHPTVKDVSDEEWVVPIQNGIYELITSRAFKTYRTDILRLASVLTERFGVSWFGLCKNDKSCLLVALLVHLVSIEIRMILEDCSIDDIVKNAALLLSCYQILECFISVSNESMWELVNKQTEKMLAAITSSIEAAIGFLISVSEQWKDLKDQENSILERDLTFATIRLLCAWLAEESISLRQEVCQILPFILQVTRESLEIPVEDSYDRPELLRFLLAPMCHLSADDMTRKVLLAEDVPTLLVKYLENKFEQLMLPGHEVVLESTLSTVCGILLNVIVLEGEKLALSETFCMLFKFLHSALPQLSSGYKYLTLQGNFSVLGLLIARHQFGKPLPKDVHFHKFLSASVKFLWNAHELTRENECRFFTLSTEYSFIWDDVMELWFLGMQALVEVLAVVPWIGGFLFTSGWPQHIVQSLKLVPCQNVESSVKLAYQNFLCSLMKNCPNNMQPLLEQGINDVARMHGLNELETLIEIIYTAA